MPKTGDHTPPRLRKELEKTMSRPEERIIRGFLFDRDAPAPAKPSDYQPAGPPKRICIVCGLKYIPEPGKDSPCGHIKADGTVVP